jgi:fatty-acyl-CoA synthase
MDLRALPAQVARAARVAQRSGLLAPRRPDRLVRAASVVRAFGPTLAGAAGVAAALHGDRTAVIDDARTLTFAELDTRTNALAHGLTAHGIASGSTVAVLARNHHEFVEAVVALAKLGADTVLLNTSMAEPQLRDVCRRESVHVVLHDDDFAGLLGAADADVELLDTARFDDLVASHTTAPLGAPQHSARIVILTSGTTGTPKGARRAAAPPAASTLGTLDAIPYRSGETMVIAAPMFHSWGFAHLTIALAIGDTMVLQPRFDPLATIEAIARRRAHVLAAVPVMLRRILEVPLDARASFDTSSLRLVPLSGSAIPRGLAEAFMDSFGEVVYNLYGSTEAGAVSVATPADLRAAPGTAGRPPAGVDVRLVDGDGHDVAPGSTGRIVVRSALVFEGYTSSDSPGTTGERSHDASREVDGYLATGDTGHFDGESRLFVDGRDDEMIVSGGENVYPREVEDLLTGHPAILEAAVIGVDDEQFGQRLRAFVVRRPAEIATALDAPTVQAYVRDHLARYKVPRDVVFVDALPRNATGKVVKRELR